MKKIVVFIAFLLAIISSPLYTQEFTHYKQCLLKIKSFVMAEPTKNLHLFISIDRFLNEASHYSQEIKVKEMMLLLHEICSHGHILLAYAQQDRSLLSLYYPDFFYPCTRCIVLCLQLFQGDAAFSIEDENFLNAFITDYQNLYFPFEEVKAFIKENLRCFKNKIKGV